ncbi:MAG: nucleotidyltransferase [Eubacterium sp.]|nr:nucleotidyltransferase [Eubacterium sp.]
MKGVGIAAEFNPFHRGHKYIIEEAKKRTGCDFLGVVMSGSFCQRGEPAGFDKFLRSKAALLNGADIVIELPVIFASSAADAFAWGSVETIEKAGIFSHMAFGVEAESLKDLERAAEILSLEPEEFKAALKGFSSEGVSFPKARELALRQIFDFPEGIFNKPNNILALEYLKAIKVKNCSLTAVGIQRIGSEYNDTEFKGKFSSGAAVRRSIEEGLFEEVKAAVPESAYSLYKERFREKQPSLEDYREALRYLILRLKPEELEKICDITEGLENKIYKNADFESVEGLISALKSKRYTESKLKRALLHILLDIKKEDVFPLPQAPYIRVLGVKKEAKGLLPELKEKAKAPVIINVKKDAEGLDGNAKKILEKEIFSTGLRDAKNKAFDFTEGLIVV